MAWRNSSKKACPGHPLDNAEVEWIATKVQETIVVNVYKPPPSRLEQCSLPDSPAPAVYAGDFNSWTPTGGTSTPPKMASSCQSGSPLPMRDPLRSKGALLFHLRLLEQRAHPDLAFVKLTGHELLPVRRILDRFPCSHHRPSLITTPSLVQSTEGKPVRRWNFRNANWADLGELSIWQPRPCQHPPPPTSMTRMKRTAKC